MVKIYLTLFVFGLLGIFGYGAYWYYNDTQQRIATLRENNAQLEVAVQTANESVDTLRADVAKFSKLNNQLQTLIENKPQEMVELIEAVILDPERKDYCYHIVHEKTKDELVFRRMDTTPWIVARYMKIPGEVFGRGPLVSALPDVKTLNKTLELLLKNASIACAGVYTAADDGVINPSNIRITPGSIIPLSLIHI